MIKDGIVAIYLGARINNTLSIVIRSPTLSVGTKRTHTHTHAIFVGKRQVFVEKFKMSG